VLIDRGASTEVATIFFVEANRLVRPTPALNRFSYGTGGRVAEAADCLMSRERTVVSVSAEREDGSWAVEERFVRLDAAANFVAAGRVRTSMPTLDGYPEFGIRSSQKILPQPFPGCTVARAGGS
jgi:hypothetical protein